jgi:hypothetical protein
MSKYKVGHLMDEECGKRSMDATHSVWHCGMQPAQLLHEVETVECDPATNRLTPSALMSATARLDSRRPGASGDTYPARSRGAACAGNGPSMFTICKSTKMCLQVKVQ